MMKKIFWIQCVFVLSLLAGCQKDGFIKTGLSDGRFDGNMLEYLQSDSYNWDSTLLMIKTAKLEALFAGNEKITFFGPTNHSIRRYMYEKKIYRVIDLGEEFCRTTLLRHVMAGKVMRDDVPRGLAGTGTQLIGTGGKYYTMNGNNQIWAYTFKSEYNDVADMGPVVLYLRSVDKKTKINIASTNIEPMNGVVHSLGYDYTLGEM